ncbi:MAG: DUF4097 family beta strand repeat protein [Actinobacteria bacterium]|jgi:hypothetical protein|nr:DUF4097 family beta strand repeat protein [Actinomycetota bacterium]
MTHVFEVTGHLRVDCRLTVGEVRLVAAEPGHARVEVTAHGEGGEELVRRGEVAVHDDGGGRQRLVVHYPAKSLLSGVFSITGRGGVDVTIHCPVGSELQARTGAAAVRAALDLGAVDIVTGSGDVELRDISGPAAIKVGSGQVRVGTIGGAAEIDTGAGGVEVAGARGAVKVRTASGRIRLGRTHESVKVTAAAGDVTIECAEQGHVAVTATTGDIEIGVPRGRQLHLDVSSTIGSIRSELEASDDVGTGATDLSLRVRATTGDITLRRAAEQASPTA